MILNSEEGEILLFNKPYRWTSFDAVNSLRIFAKMGLGIKKLKVGHAGTLDPLATGLLILCTGKMCKRIEEFKEFDKEYTGTFTIGATTPSFDLETEVDQTFTYDHVTTEKIIEASQRLSGTFYQLPPNFSAVKVAGKRAYEYARKDQEVIIQPKQVTIPQFEIVKIELPVIEFRIVCSKGTYIRAIARDFGVMLNCGAYLSSLCRTRIGPHNLADAHEPDEWKRILTEEASGHVA
jgi:tRNA pseudouridine55 synthase